METNADGYVKILREYLLPELRIQRVTLQNRLFQQDLATPYTSGIAQQFLETKFWERLISNGILSERSPPDFHVIVYLRGKIYKHAPQVLKVLKSRFLYYLGHN